MLERSGAWVLGCLGVGCLVARVFGCMTARGPTGAEGTEEERRKRRQKKNKKKNQKNNKKKKTKKKKKKKNTNRLPTR